MEENVLRESAIFTLSQCISYIKSAEIAKAISETKLFIEMCKSIIERNAHCSEIANEALVFGIFFRGIQNFANLKKMTASSDWIKRPELIEQIWFEMWDCKERLEYTLPLIEMVSLEWIFKDINSIYREIYRTFGQGLYISPGFFVKRMVCSICGQDIRACEHIPGIIYFGKICAKVPKGIVGDHFLITKNPEDPRCRIWPWQAKNESNEKEGNVYDNVCLLYFFKLDDFMYEGGYNSQK